MGVVFVWLQMKLMSYQDEATCFKLFDQKMISAMQLRQCKHVEICTPQLLTVPIVGRFFCALQKQIAQFSVQFLPVIQRAVLELTFP
jgi:hypothetical protein